jgi:hypothetical protein
MPIDDIDYLKQNSVKKSFQFLIDSKDRDHIAYPEPSSYSITFDVPFYNVAGFQLIDATIPRTMYNIDVTQNALSFYIYSSNVDITQVHTSNYSGASGDRTIQIGDYTIQTLTSALNGNVCDTYNNYYLTPVLGMTAAGTNNAAQITAQPLTVPAELQNVLQFTCPYPFAFDMKATTMAESLGFDILPQASESSSPYPRYSNIQCKPLIDYANTTSNLSYINNKLFASVYNSFTQQYELTAPGMYSLFGDRTIIVRCPEIETHSFGSLAYTKHCLGVAKIRLGVIGYSDNNTVTTLPLREFHPIGKLPKLSFRFERLDGSLYNFRGTNHTMTFAIYYYEPVPQLHFTQSILNPEYNPNFIEYFHRNVEDEDEESDDQSEDYNRDSPPNYKIVEARHLPESIQQLDEEAKYRFNLGNSDDS